MSFSNKIYSVVLAVNVSCTAVFSTMFLPSRWRIYTLPLEMSVAFPAGSSCSGNQGAGRESGSINEKAGDLCRKP